MKNQRIEKLVLSNLRVDNGYGGYQRQLNNMRVKKGIATFKESLVDIPLVAKRPDGSMYIVDGNHTVNILMGSGWTEYDCNVMDSDGRTSEAPIFVECNEPGTGGVTVRPYDRYIAGLSSNMPLYVAMKNIMLEVGVEITKPSTPTNTTTCSIGTLQDMLKSNRKVSKATRFIRKTCPTDANCWTAEIIKGCVDFVSRMTDEQLIVAQKRLKKKTCLEISSRASTVAMALGKHRLACVSDVLESIANIK